MASGGGDFVNSDDSNEEGWEEEEMEDFSFHVCPCLFCEKEFSTAEQIFLHCKQVHGFNINKLKRRLKLDCFSYIRMINYIRSERPLAQCLKNSSAANNEWCYEKYMAPVSRDDILLTFDIESCESEEDDSEVSKDCDEVITITRKEHNELLERLKLSEMKAEKSEETLNLALANMDKVKNFAQNYFLGNENVSKEIAHFDDDSYFSTYSHYSIHLDMLQDKIRTESYRDAIFLNKQLLKQKIVLDVGCGTSILSCFAAKAGAKKVIAVDQSDIIYNAMDIVIENELNEKITFQKGKLEDIDLRVDKVDVIISEWMGYFLYFECMLDTVIYARDKYLKKGGLILPNRTVLSIAGISDLERYKKFVSFWDDVYGFKMSCMKKDAIKEVSVECVNANSVVTTSAVVSDLNLETCTSQAIEFVSQFVLTVLEEKPIVALVAYFDVYFDLEHKVSFSTSPTNKPTHWKQSLMYFENPIIRNKGDVIYGSIRCQRFPKDPRSLCLYLIIDGERFEYVLQ